MSPSNPKKEEISTAGYPRIERLIDTEGFDPINKSFATAFGELEKISKQKAGLGKAKLAKKAIRSYELVMDLLKELLKLKYQLAEASKQNPGSKK